jgi:tRNA pseudouridine38-40 synthase
VQNFSATEMPNFKITLQYDGTDYNGWQIQPNGRTIQGELTRVLSQLDGRPITVHGAGRTDAGVHAEGQVASFQLERSFKSQELRDAVNGNLDRDIRVFRVEEVPTDFNARFSAKLKTYRYRIWTSDVVSPFLRRYVHHYRGPLEIIEIRKLSALLIGRHDFSGFTVSSSDSSDHTRTIERIEILEQNDILELLVSAPGFLRYMVRTVAGTLLDVGRGHLPIESAIAALNTGVRSKAGPTLPACGLTLVSIDY